MYTDNGDNYEVNVIKGIYGRRHSYGKGTYASGGSYGDVKGTYVSRDIDGGKGSKAKHESSGIYDVKGINEAYRSRGRYSGKGSQGTNGNSGSYGVKGNQGNYGIRGSYGCLLYTSPSPRD